MNTAQGERQDTVRASTQTTLTYEGDWHALFDQGGVAAGAFNERLLAWINAQLGAAWAALPDAMQAFASSQAADDWSSMGVFTIMAKNNFTAAVAPSTANDASQGYSPGSFWLNTATAQMWFCRDGAAGDAAWEMLDTADQPGYVSGAWYVPLNAQVAAGAALSNGAIKALPFVIKSRVTISTLGARITTASAGGNIQLAIYANSPAAMRPTGTALASTGSISTTSTGNVSAAPSGGNFTLEPGLYWAAVNADNATVVMQTLATSSAWAASLTGSPNQASVSSGNANASLALSYTQAFGAWPDLTAGSPSEVGNTSALIQFKVA